MRKAPDLDALYGSAQPPRAKPGRASGIQKAERSMKDGMVKINVARIFLNPNITPNLPQILNVVRQELQNGGVFKWTVSRNGETILAPYKLSKNLEQLVLAALKQLEESKRAGDAELMPGQSEFIKMVIQLVLTALEQSERADDAELMPGQSEFIKMVIEVLNQIVTPDEDNENKLSDHLTQVTARRNAFKDALKNKKLTLGHPTLVGGFKEPEGRMGGELRYGKLTDNSDPTFYINNDSGRYGEYEDRNKAMLENVAKRFENIGLSVKVQWIDKKPKADLINKPGVLDETSSSRSASSDASLNGSSTRDRLAANDAALQRSASFDNNRM